MISPYASGTLNALYIEDDATRADLEREAEGLPSVLVSSGAAAAAVMLGSGYFSPMTGYMNVAQARSVADDMTLPGGPMWPVPLLNVVPGDAVVEGLGAGARIALRDPNVDGNPVLAIQQVKAIETLSGADKANLIAKVFGTDDGEHPGVTAFAAQGDQVISGPIQVLNLSYFPIDFPDTFRTAGQIRAQIEALGWEKVVAFQTRNPMHRAHEELCRMAQQAVKADGILIHMLLGKLKPGDIPADIRDASIRKMVEIYFPADTVLITGYGFDMLYAGPREAVLHAIFRQNSGCTHLIVGRDHAGVGNYYGPFDAQSIFDEVPSDDLQIEIFRGDHTVWCNKCDEVVMMRDCPHGGDDYLFLSGTQVRNMLAAGETLPPEFARPEVAAILMEYYQSESG